MARVLVIHREPAEAAELAARLRDRGVEAQPYLTLGPRGFRGIRGDPPDAILIDLNRAPSYGRTMGALLRESASLRTIPLVFIAGEPAKTAAAKRILPDAFYAPWSEVPAAIKRAIARAPRNPLAPRPPARSVAQKLGIEPDSAVALCHAPAEFALDLPAGVRVRKHPDGAAVVLVFARSAAALARELPAVAGLMEKGRRVWLLWPKKASKVESGLTMPRVRELAIATGLIDYKVCAVDATWSAMAVGPRRGGRG
ncbi:MAG: hypothetical protein JST11_09430 [Acidobacteria bacterium]|nr:hypothetical protein [Acidobacteriota bacterium]